MALFWTGGSVIRIAVHCHYSGIRKIFVSKSQTQHSSKTLWQHAATMHNEEYHILLRMQAILLATDKRDSGTKRIKFSIPGLKCC